MKRVIYTARKPETSLKQFVAKVSGHLDYSRKMDLILKTIGVRTCDQTSNIQSHLRKSRSQSPVRKLTHLGVPGMATSKSDSVLVEPGTDVQLATSCRTASVSTGDSGFGRTGTELSLSDVSSMSFVSRDYQGQDLYDLTLSQNSLASQSQSDSVDFAVPSNTYKDFSLDSLFISDDCPLSNLPSSTQWLNVSNVESLELGDAASSVSHAGGKSLETEFKFTTEDVTEQPIGSRCSTTNKDNS